MRYVSILLMAIWISCNSKSVEDLDEDGYTTAQGDCDDDEASANPEGVETCDGLDNDCDGTTDNPDTPQSWADTDGDLHGDVNAPNMGCEARDGDVSTSDDCDDADPTTFPGGTEVCDGADNDCNGEVDQGVRTVFYTDDDGDGAGNKALPILACEQGDYALEGDDCDDAEPAAFPGNPEICDDIDNDCDGEVDNGAGPWWYRDRNADGYGDTADTVQSCDPPDGYSAEPGDPIDTDKTVYPGAKELCDGIDNDGDGSIDEDSPDAYTFYADKDGDGDGDASSTAKACEAPENYVTGKTDCDDTDATVYKGATETCDLKDNDCDSKTDEGFTSSSWYTDADGDGYGAGTAVSTGCMASTAGTVSSSTDCDDTVATVSPAASETCNSVDDDCDGTVDDGVTTTYYKDADGDGYGDKKSTRAACSTPTGYVTSSNDCDDTSSAISPAGTESCNSKDDDCDGVVDDGVKTTYYKDGDGDGYGLSTSSSSACSAPTGYVTDKTDCDDAVSTTYPGAPETCYDSADNDCDGTVDDGCKTKVSHCGVISASETWDSDYRHMITCNVSVEGTAKPKLTIEDGAEVYVTKGYGLTVGNANTGSIDIQGTTTGVTFTSNETTPKAGDWSGITLGYYDQGSTIDGLTVEYGGRNGYGNLYLYYNITSAGTKSATITDTTSRYSSNSGLYLSTYASAKVTGSTFEGNTSYGVYLDGSSTLATGTTATFTGNTITDNGYPIALQPEYVRQLDATSSFSGNDNDVVVVHAGTVASSGTWQDLGVPYYVNGTVYVQGSASPKLTIADGVDMEFANYTQLSVGNSSKGSLAVSGTSSGVTMTSGDAAPAAGDWYGLYIGYYDQSSTIDGLTIEYGGYAGNGNIQLYYNTTSAGGKYVTVTDSISRYSSSAGIYLGTYAMADISTSTFEDNSGYGVYVDSSSYLVSTSGPTFTDNVVTDNGYPIGLPPQYVAQLDATSTFSGNDNDHVMVHAGTVTTSGTWQDLDADYQVNGTVYVQGSASPKLTISDGAKLSFANYTGMYVGNSDKGALAVSGSSAGVTFTSADATPAAGDWYGLNIGNYDQSSVVDGLTIEYAGANGYGNIYLYYNTTSAGTKLFTLTDSTSRYSSTAGMYLQTYAMADISTSTFEDNAGYGVYVDTNSYLYAVSGPTFTDNTLIGNGYPMAVPPEYVQQLDDSSSFVGNDNDLVVVHGGTVSTSGIWEDLDADLYMSGTTYVQGAASPKLTIKDGSTLKFATSTAMYVGNSNKGSLSVEGTTTGVTMTSSQATKRAGDWYGIQFGNYDQSSTIDGLTVEYGGGWGYGNIYLYYNTTSAGTKMVTFTDVVSRYSSNYGMYLGTYALASISGSDLSSNAGYGLYVDTSSALYATTAASFTSNTLTDNSYPIALPAEYVRQLDASSSFDGNDNDLVVVHGGTVSTSGTWQDLDSDYLMNGTVYVQGAASPKVTLADGVGMRYGANTALYVGNSNKGSIEVKGTSSGVKMTSAQTTKAAGDWYGVQFGNYDQSSTVDGLTIEYGGGWGYGNMYLYYNTTSAGTKMVTITNSTSRYSSSHGIYLGTYALADISGSSFSDNYSYGVYVDTSSYLASTSGPTFTDNELTGNSYPIALPPEYVQQLDSSSTYAGNDNDLVVIHSGTVATSGSWQDLDSPYLVNGTLYVQGAATPKLTIKDGTQVNFATSTGMYVGSSSQGSLVVQGTTSGVKFTSNKAVPAAGDWYGVQFGYYDQSSNIDGLTIEYGGAWGYGDIYLYNNTTSAATKMVTITDSIVRNSSTYGIYLGSNAKAAISGTRVEDNTGYGVYVDSSSSLSTTSGPTFKDNSLSGNDYPISLPPEYVAQLDTTSSYDSNDNDYIVIQSGTVSSSATWKDWDVDGLVAGSVTVQGSSSPVLTISAGNKLRFAASTGLYIASSAYGSLYAVGTATQPVTFTSSKASPAKGDWLGIQLGYYDKGSTLEYDVVEYGGANGAGDVYAYYCSASTSIKNSTIAYSSTYGIYRYGCTPTISGITYVSNTSGTIY